MSSIRDFRYWISRPSLWGKTPYQAMQERILRKIRLANQNIIKEGENNMPHLSKVHKIGEDLANLFNSGHWDCTCECCISFFKAIVAHKNEHSVGQNDYYCRACHHHRKVHRDGRCVSPTLGNCICSEFVV